MEGFILLVVMLFAALGVATFVGVVVVGIWNAIQEFKEEHAHKKAILARMGDMHHV